MRTIPRKSDLNKLYDIINKNSTKKDFYTLIHCFNGLNRTGYLICFYLCKRLGLKSAEAIQRFEEARNMKMYRENLVRDL